MRKSRFSLVIHNFNKYVLKTRKHFHQILIFTNFARNIFVTSFYFGEKHKQSSYWSIIITNTKFNYKLMHLFIKMIIQQNWFLDCNTLAMNLSYSYSFKRLWRTSCYNHCKNKYSKSKNDVSHYSKFQTSYLIQLYLRESHKIILLDAKKHRLNKWFSSNNRSFPFTVKYWRLLFFNKIFTCSSFIC